MHVARNAPIYSAAAPAEFLYVLAAGFAKTCAAPASGPRITGLAFPGDLLGLEAGGRYLDSAIAVTSATLQRIPRAALAADPALAAELLDLACAAARHSRRHALILGRRDAIGKVGMLLAMIAERRAGRRRGVPDLYFPLSRADTADYIGLSAAALSRALRALVDRGIVRLIGRRHLRVIDADELSRLIAPGTRAPRRRDA